MSAPRMSALAGMMLAAAAGISAGPAPAARASTPAPSREYVVPSKGGRRRRKKKQVKKADPNAGVLSGPKLPHARKASRASLQRSAGAAPSQKWQRLKNGGAIDGRGDYRSPKRLHRLALCQQAGMPSASGRQWVRLRRLIASARRTMGGAR